MAFFIYAYSAFMMYASVIVNIPLNTVYTYEIPARFRPKVIPGARVLVPIENRLVTGLVFALSAQNTSAVKNLKSIHDVLDNLAVLSPASLQLIEWISNYYICGFAESSRLFFPNGIDVRSYLLVAPHKKNTIAANAQKGIKKDILMALQNGPLTQVALGRHLKRKLSYGMLKKMEDDGLLTLQRMIDQPQVKPQIRTHYRLQAEASVNGLTAKQMAVYNALKRKPDVLLPDLLQQCGVSASVVQAMHKKGLLLTLQKPVHRQYKSNYKITSDSIKLNGDQERAVSKIASGINQQIFEVILLHGITGSGKTEVYINAMYHALRSDKSVMCLVPEIALTPQTVARFQQRFDENIAIFHSRLGQGERYDMWRRVEKGDIRIVVGARSALFAPLQNPGLIILDEEHELTYKQQEKMPLYNARSVAVMLGRQHQIPVVLGSATPAVESYYNTTVGKYQRLSLPGRAVQKAVLPQVLVIDMKSTPITRDEHRLFSDLMLEKIGSRLYAGEQVLLLQNRRGFSAYLECSECNHIETCPHCAITLAHHQSDARLKCHYCGYTRPKQDACSNCGELALTPRGSGTQKIETILARHFPTARIGRMDYDSTRSKRGHEKILNQFASHQTDILIGTQMIAKGIDIHNVTLVGIVLADIGLFLPDFRAAEKMFQLLTQVAGRTGRGDKSGEVVVQTYHPDNPVIADASTHNYRAFYEREIANRKATGYPPFTLLTMIRFEHSDASIVAGEIAAFAKHLEQQLIIEGLQILGPVPSPVEKLKGKYRWQILCKIDRSRNATGRDLRHWLYHFFVINRESKNYISKLSIDVDPVWMM
jgi:primosomal protein N' (replication factor Y)